jgi:ribonuclease J
VSGSVSVTFLGGLGDIGRNCAVLEIDGRLIVLDCGQLFGDDLTPGVDTILPDLSYIVDRADRVDGVIATHAHEDHIGALPFLMDKLDCPIYGSPFTIGMIEGKLGMAGIRGTEVRRINDGETHRIGPIDCEFIPVTHSTPSGLITAFHTPQGVILHSCDFKLDLTPIDGRLTDLSRIGSLGSDPGIRLLLCDSTNADSPGISESESAIGGVLQSVLDKRPDQRIIVAAFSSHIHRVQQVADAAVGEGRKVATLGRSMQRNTSLAKDLGLLKIPDENLIDIDDIGDYEPGRVCIVCTGSQGEERSALATMASGDNRWVSIGDDDCVVFSSHPIPGNEAAVARLRNDLTKRGAEVVHSGHVDVHTTGHGKAYELRALHAVSSPEFFVPVHGEYYHMLAHSRLAESMGMDPDNIKLCGDGDRVTLSDDGISREKVTDGRYIYVDGIEAAIDRQVIDERIILGSDGFVGFLVEIDRERFSRVGEVEIVTRGWVEGDEADEFVDAVRKALIREIDGFLADQANPDDFSVEDVAKRARRAAGRTINKTTKRRPMIVPMVRERGGKTTNSAR